MGWHPMADYIPFAVILNEKKKSREAICSHINSFKYTVIGGNHSLIATMRNLRDSPNIPVFHTRMCRIYLNAPIDLVRQVWMIKNQIS